MMIIFMVGVFLGMAFGDIATSYDKKLEQNKEEINNLIETPKDSEWV